MANQQSSSNVVSTADAKEYVFNSFDGLKTIDGQVRTIELKELDGREKQRSPEHQKVIKAERQQSEEKKFSISPIVKQYRGINDQEKNERDLHLEEQIEKRLIKIREDAFQKGYQDGLERGHKDAIAATQQAALERLSTLDEMIQNVLATETNILKNQKIELYTLIKTLTKWVILRELKDDGLYVMRLLEKLVIEIGQKDHLLIQVNKVDFERMPEILQAVEAKMGKLNNVRYECDQDVHGQGVVVESMNSIIRGTLEDQLSNLDKLFETVDEKTDAKS